MSFRIPILALGAALLVSACGGGPTYATNKPDDSYDLQAMSLAEEDLPVGFLRQDARIFNNQDWAAVLPDPANDPQKKQNQLDAQGRITGAATFFSWNNPEEHLGRPYQITTQSTLYATADDASKSLKMLCDLPVDPSNPLTDFKVTGLGDEATGFMSTQTIQGFGDSVDTAVCFRTGRIIHAVVQSGLEGTQDVALNVRLAQKMLARVDDALKGKTTPSKAAQGGPAPAPSRTSEASPVPSPAATANATSSPKAGN